MTIGRIPSVEGGIQPTIVDAKGDLIAGVAADSVNRLAVGSNDQVLVADSGATTGMAWKPYGAQFVAGKNKIINGDFLINQRNFTSNTANQAYNFDRWYQFNGGTSGTQTVTPETFTLGAAPVAGYEGKNFLRSVTAAGADVNTRAGIAQRIESVRTFAGQTVTFSFWAKAGSGTPKIGLAFVQNFGTGGSPSAEVSTPISAVTISTSWTRYYVSVVIPSISGKTLGTAGNDFLNFVFWLTAGSDFATIASSIGIQNNTFDIWGVQVEAGSAATPFTTATGTIQGELAACQRYYEICRGNVISPTSTGGLANTYTSAFSYKVTKRAIPTLTIFSGEDQAGTSGSATWYAGNVATVAAAAQEMNQADYFSLRRAGSTDATLVAYSFTASAEL